MNLSFDNVNYIFYKNSCISKIKKQKNGIVLIFEDFFKDWINRK